MSKNKDPYPALTAEERMLERKRQIDRERKAQAILREQARRRSTAILMAQVARSGQRRAS